MDCENFSSIEYPMIPLINIFSDCLGSCTVSLAISIEILDTVNYFQVCTLPPNNFINFIRNLTLWHAVQFGFNY
jgi:hypothetical protein